ncbi:hypothetical protein ACPBEH_02380 [Latilactobacillus sp. 5-91]|uniref:hypothetical protein n=1 Tax=Latilactobacillus sp. 5-91 TaxID=3410924 RepID=UPI003C7308DE
MENNSKKLSDILIELQFVSGNEILSSDIYKDLKEYIKNKRRIPYVEVSRIVYRNELKDTSFLDSLNDVLSNSQNFDSHEKALRKKLYKLVDHIQLASMQKIELLDEPTKKIDKLNNDLDSREKEIKNLKKENEDLLDKYKNLYSEYIGILGIFTAITFATFGGLQLLGNVFGNIKDTDSVSVGSELMLGAVFLFGTYMILVALLTGISKLMGKDYKTSYPTRFLVVFSFFIIFVFGLIYANVNYMESIFTEHAFWWSIGLIIVTVVIGIVAINVDKWHQKRHP